MLLLTVACSNLPTRGPVEQLSAPDQQFSVEQSKGIFVIRATHDDEQTVRDIANALELNAPQILDVLNCDYREQVAVDIFPDQESLDRYGMNPQMRGYFAYSGNHRIQMVSPRNSLPNMDIPYEGRVLIAVHEFVHLVNDQINPEMPLWLDEGVASRIGPGEVYKYVSEHLFPFELAPRFQVLNDTYDEVPAADLFAYAAVDFVVEEFGTDTLIKLMRAPGALEQVVGISTNEFDAEWHAYMQRNYKNEQP